MFGVDPSKIYETEFGERGSVEEAFNMLKASFAAGDTELFVHWLGELGARVKRQECLTAPA